MSEQVAVQEPSICRYPTNHANWQIGKTALECLVFMFNNEISCDVTFNISDPTGDISKMKAHEFILKARSPVFEAMLEGNFVEASSKTIDIEDVDPGLFKSVLRYLYCDEVDITFHNVLAVRNMAKMYMLQNLEKLCDDFVENQFYEEITCDNVFTVLSEAVGLCQDDAVQQCLEFCGHNTRDVLKFDVSVISHDALLRLVKYDRLEDDCESQLLRYCIKWAEKKAEHSQEGIRDILGDIIYNIRFTEMTSNQFTNVVPEDSPVMTSEEKLSVMYYINMTNDCNKSDLLKNNRFSQMGFDAKLRVANFSKQKFIVLTDVQVANYEHHGSEHIKIEPKWPVVLHGFTIITGKDINSSVLYQLSSSNDRSIIPPTKTPYFHLMSGQTYTIWLERSVKLEPGEVYTLKCSIEDGKNNRCLVYNNHRFQNAHGRKCWRDLNVHVETVKFPATMKYKESGRVHNLSLVKTVYIQLLEFNI